MALVTVGAARDVMAGTVQGGAATLARGRVRLENQSRFRTREAVLTPAAGGRLAVAMDGLISSRCEALTLRRAGPAGAVPEAKLAGLAGTYSGFDYGVALRDLPGTDPIENLSWATQVAIDIAADGKAAVYTKSRPIDAPPAKQDRFVTTLRPLTVGEDGRPLFVAMAPRRQEGAFAQDPVGPGAMLLALKATGDGMLEAERIGDRRGGMLLPRLTGDCGRRLCRGRGTARPPSREHRRHSRRRAEPRRPVPHARRLGGAGDRRQGHGPHDHAGGAGADPAAL